MPRVKKPAKVKDLYGVTGNSPDGNGGEHIRIHPYFYGIYYNDNSTAANTETDYCAVDQKKTIYPFSHSHRRILLQGCSIN